MVNKQTMAGSTITMGCSHYRWQVLLLQWGVLIIDQSCFFFEFKSKCQSSSDLGPSTFSCEKYKYEYIGDG